MSNQQNSIPNKAATSSAGVIRGILRNPADLQQFKTAVERALVYDKCAALGGDAKAACQLDKALVNVAAIFAQQVEGRVSTEVDPRTAFDTDAVVERGRNLVALFQELGVPKDKFLLRIPATWEGIQAAKVLEAEGAATHIIMVYSFVQAAAAAQAGVSVLSPNVGRIGDFYQRNPGAIRDPKGPRQDAGTLPGQGGNPGIGLVQRIYNYVQQKTQGRTKVMVSGVRTSEEAFELAGVDYMTVSPSVLKSLQASATMSGYNDGLSGAAETGDTIERRLSPASAAEEEFSQQDAAPVTKESFQEGLDRAGLELLQQGVQGLVEAVERLIPDMSSIAIDAE
jgi:transaldolase